MMVFWLIFAILTLLTVLWAVLIRADVRAYIESQVKVLGEENRPHVDTKKAKVFFVIYMLILLVILAVYALSSLASL